MSRYEYDYDDELDDSLGLASRNILRKTTHISEKAWIDSMMREKEVKAQSKARHDIFMGTRRFHWQASLLGGDTVKGEIMIPEEEAQHPDIATMRAFEIVFQAVKVSVLGVGTFRATIEGRPLGMFRLADDVLMERDVFGRVRSHYGRGQEAIALDWLRRNIDFRITDGEKTYPPYQPAIPKKSPGMPVADAAKLWSEGLATKKKPKEVWEPLNTGQNMAAIGVNLSNAHERGVTNLAFSTQLEQTSRAGQSVNQKDLRAAPVVQMHLEGKVIG